MEGTFTDFSREVVAGFLQTVVVLDDGAYLEPTEPTGEIVEPDQSRSIPEEEGEGVAAAVKPHVSPNALDAQALITSFAERGLVCGVLVPWKDDPSTDATLQASRRADIVILDWQLGDEGEKATGLIQTLLEQDEARGGRLRMIVVYTAKPDLDPVRSAVADAVPALKVTDGIEGSLALTGDHTRVVFIRKGKTSEISKAVSEGDLADRLINEFVQLGSGILSNVALGAIAAIRDETHKVLARFHPDLDAAFLTHRLLLVTPDDAEGYAVDLLTAEFQSILNGRNLGRTHAGPEVIEAALTEISSGGAEYRLMTQKNSEDQSVVLTTDQLMTLIRKGPVGLGEIQGLNVGGAGSLHQRVYLLRGATMAAGLATHRQFSRVSAYARERTTVPPEWVARLDLGSVVKKGDEYFLCIQPACDTLRLTEPTQFIFSALRRDEIAFDLVVRDAGGAEICLRLETKASKISVATFTPDPGTGTVLSKPQAEDYALEAASGEIFAWIADLRASTALRFAHRVANDLARIGIDEFEWQRRFSPSA
jgi:hypothetical protein